MGNFQQHITCSTVTGIAVAGVAYHCGFPPEACLVAAGLCSFAGMLPDIDSNTSKSFQECIYLTAGVGCILAVSRLRYHGIDPDLAMLGGALFFLLVRFGLGTSIKKFTSHRGMIHSVPVAILCGQLVFFAVPGTFEDRLLKAAALTIGFLSHLILDEVYSIDSSGSSIRLKRSFGTALKWTNPKKKGLVTSLYVLIFCLGFAICSNPAAIENMNGRIEMSTHEVSQPLREEVQDCEIQREAAAFLLQLSIPSLRSASPEQSYSQQTNNLHNLQALSASEPVEPVYQPASQLPSAMQIDMEWHRRMPVQPAAIIFKQ